MPSRRPVERGSFGGHFDELLPLFPEPPAPPATPGKRSVRLQERIDIHAALFERAWQVKLG